jgi:Cys-rich repeat protein
VKFPFHILLVAASVALSACNKSDLGTPCPPPAGDTSTASSQPASGDEVDTPATFRKDSTCESFLCVSSQTRSNYCSQECFSNSNCPDGFVCETLQPVGEYKDTKFCLLGKVCNSDNDCPKGSFYCNKTIPTSVPGTFAQFCDVTGK